MVCRGAAGVLEVLEMTDLDFWTEFHSLVARRELFLAWGGDLVNMVSDRIAVSFKENFLKILLSFF